MPQSLYRVQLCLTQLAELGLARNIMPCSLIWVLRVVPLNHKKTISKTVKAILIISSLPPVVVVTELSTEQYHGLSSSQQ